VIVRKYQEKSVHQLM